MIKSADQHLKQVHLNFSSSKKQLAKELAERHKIDWDTILEQLCVKVLEAERTGEPVIELCPSEDSQPPRFYLPPIIIENYPIIIFGERSSVKSLTALILATTIMMPWTDNPLGLEAPEKGISTLYADWETDSQTVEWQLARLGKGLGVHLVGLSYRRMSVPLAQDVEQVSHYLERTKSKVLVVDSLGPAVGGEDLNASGPAIAFFQSLRKLHVTSIILAHTRKGEQGNAPRTVFGSSYFENMARGVWECRKSQQADENTLEVGLFHRKPAPFQKLCHPWGFRLTFTDTSISVERHDPRNVREFIAAMGTQQQVLDVLQDGPQTTGQIQTTLDITGNNTRVTLKRLRDKGQVVKLGDKWALASRDSTPEEFR